MKQKRKCNRHLELTHTVTSTFKKGMSKTTKLQIFEHCTSAVERVLPALSCSRRCTPHPERGGFQAGRVELGDPTLPVNLQRRMASEAEAAREARAKLPVHTNTLTHTKSVLQALPASFT